MSVAIRWCVLVLIVAELGASSAQAQRDRGSWRKTLRDKAMFFEKNAAERHNILGTYPSSVRLLPPRHYAGPQTGAWKKIVQTGELPPGWVVDHGTTGLSNIAHTSSWTGCLLTSQAFRVAFARRRYGQKSAVYRAARARADEVIQGLRILTLVSGQPGYLARGVALGHGISYEERAASDTRDLWRQGAGAYSNLRYRGGPSHHNYDQVFRGLGIYYVLAADDRQKQKIHDIVRDMSNWAHLRHNMVVMHADGKRESTVLIGGWRGLGGDDRPSGGSLMALTGLKIAHLVTGNEKLKALYDHWVARLGLLDPDRNGPSIMGPARSNYDDTDHLLGDLYLLNLIEKDPKLLAYYRKCVKDSWQVHKLDKMAWFNFVYRAVLGSEFGDPAGSLWNLQTHPTCRVFQPQLNSIRTDIEFFTRDGRRGWGRGPVRESRRPLPVYQRPSDNEYAWKGSPYRLDGWTSRTVAVLEISPHDPYVQLAAEASGAAYWSNTRGEVWQALAGLGGVTDLAFAPHDPAMVLAATRGGVYRSVDGAAHWQRTLERPAVRLRFGNADTSALYAVCADGVYKSAGLGPPAMGTVWRKVSAALPAGATTVLAVDPTRKPAGIFALSPSGFYAMREGDAQWQAQPRPERTRGFSDVDPIGGTPLWLRADRQVTGRLFRAIRLRDEAAGATVVSVSDDDGKSWSPVVRELKPLVDWSRGTAASPQLDRGQLRQLFERLGQFQIQDLRVDRRDSNTWYGMLQAGVAVSRDAGRTWRAGARGLDIPRVGAIWIPRHADLVMAGTPAGMYVSSDRAENWQETPLVLQEAGAIRAEIGGAGYLTAYWMGRYHDFITEEEAGRVWWEEP